MKTKLLSIYTMVLFSCAPALIQFNESENHVQVFEDLTGTKDQLFLKANTWMISTFKSAESVIQHSDKQEGAIIGKYLMSGLVQGSQYGTADSRVYAIIDIRVKDNKARIEIKPQGQWNYDSSGMTIYDYSKGQAIGDMKNLAKSFHEALLKGDVKF